jgi:hypothetical protein
MGHVRSVRDNLGDGCSRVPSTFISVPDAARRAINALVTLQMAAQNAGRVDAALLAEALADQARTLKG